jgi:hypothetical protein
MPSFNRFGGFLSAATGFFLVLGGAIEIHEYAPGMVEAFIVGCGGVLLIVAGGYLIGDKG